MLETPVPFWTLKLCNIGLEYYLPIRAVKPTYVSVSHTYNVSLGYNQHQTGKKLHLLKATTSRRHNVSWHKLLRLCFIESSAILFWIQIFGENSLAEMTALRSRLSLFFTSSTQQRSLLVVLAKNWPFYKQKSLFPWNCTEYCPSDQNNFRGIEVYSQVSVDNAKF